MASGGVEELVDRAGGLHLRDYSPLSAPLTIADALHPPSYRDQRWVLLEARRPGLQCAALVAWEPCGDGRASVDIVVDPAHRREGLGTRLLEVTKDVAGEHGISVLSFKAHVGSEGEGFLIQRRARQVGCGHRLRLELPWRVSMWSGLARPPVGPWEALSWAGDALPYSSGTLLVSGDGADAQTRRRQRNESWRANGYRWFTAVVRESSSGCAVATSELVIASERPGIGFVTGTWVDPRLRGRGLATYVKSATLQCAVNARARLRCLHTFNHAANVEMLAVNRRLGFAPVANLAFWDVIV